MEEYIKVLSDELEDAKRRLRLSDEEGRNVIKRQIKEIKRDIERMCSYEHSSGNRVVR